MCYHSSVTDRGILLSVCLKLGIYPTQWIQPEQVKKPENIAHISIHDLDGWMDGRKELDTLHLTELVHHFFTILHYNICVGFQSWKTVADF